MSPTDKKKIMIAGGIVLVAILAIFFFLRSRGPSGAPTGTSGGAFPTTAQTPGGTAPAPGAAQTSQTTPQAPGAVGTAGTGSPAAGAGTGAAGPFVGLVQIGSGPELPTRRDPFFTFETPPQPIPPELTVTLPPVALEEGGLRPPGIQEAVALTGRRRVLGIVFNENAYAILEKDNETFVVKPGDIVDGNRVTAITPDAIFIVDAQGRRWRVTLGGAGIPTGGISSAVGGVPGMPELPPS